MDTADKETENTTPAPDRAAPRPNLEKIPVFSWTAISSAMGAIMAPAFGFAYSALRQRKVEKAQRVTLSELAGVERMGLMCDSIWGAALSGTIIGATLITHNSDAKKTKPYVERLEAERDALLTQKANAQAALK